MSKDEIITRLIAENFNLRDQLAQEKESSDFWYKEAQKRIPAQPLTMEETVHALAHTEIPSPQEVRHEDHK